MLSDISETFYRLDTIPYQDFRQLGENTDITAADSAGGNLFKCCEDLMRECNTQLDNLSFHYCDDCFSTAKVTLTYAARLGSLSHVCQLLRSALCHKTYAQEFGERYEFLEESWSNLLASMPRLRIGSVRSPSSCLQREKLVESDSHMDKRKSCSLLQGSYSMEGTRGGVLGHPRRSNETCSM